MTAENDFDWDGAVAEAVELVVEEHLIDTVVALEHSTGVTIHFDNGGIDTEDGCVDFPNLLLQNRSVRENINTADYVRSLLHIFYQKHSPLRRAVKLTVIEEKTYVNDKTIKHYVIAPIIMKSEPFFKINATNKELLELVKQEFTALGAFLAREYELAAGLA